MSRLLSLVIVAACLLLLQFSCIWHSAPDDKRPTIAFSYHKKSKDDIRYLSRFDIVVTGELEDRDTVKGLKKHGAKLILYDWLPAMYYCRSPREWEQLVYQNRFFWTLDPEDTAPNPMGEKNGCIDLFYDLANPELREARALYLIGLIRDNGYDGVFFDWGSGWHSLIEHNYSFVTDAFKVRHPGVDYDDGVNQFIKKLKESGLTVIMNGGFRSPEGVTNKYADFDIVESMFTTTMCAEKYEVFIPPMTPTQVCDTWFNSAKRALELSLSLPEIARRSNPTVRFLFLDYAFPFHQKTGGTEKVGGKNIPIVEKRVDRQAIFFSLSSSYLGNSSGFSCGPEVSLEYVKDDIFLFQIGAPLGPVQELGGDNFVRFFSRGFVVVSNEGGTFDITLPRPVKRVLDLYSGQQLKPDSSRLTITLKSEAYPSGSSRPVGRIFSY